MNCQKCYAPNDDGARFCNNCGESMISGSNSNIKISDILLFLYILISFVSVIVQFAIKKLEPNWFESPVKYIQGAFWILGSLSMILIPISIKNNLLKIVGLIISILVIIYWLISNVQFLIR